MHTPVPIPALCRPLTRRFLPLSGVLLSRTPSLLQHLFVKRNREDHFACLLWPIALRSTEGQYKSYRSLFSYKHFVNQLGINALTSAEPGYPNDGAVFHDTAVWIRRVDLDGAARL